MVTLDPAFLAGRMDDVITSLGESATLKTYTDSTTDGYLDSDTTATEESITIVISPMTEAEKVYSNQGNRVIGDFRGAILSTTSITIQGGVNYLIVGQDGTTYEVVALDDNCDISGTKTGLDVILRRRDI